MAFILAFVLLGITLPFPISSLSKLAVISRAAIVPNTVLGTYSRSNTVATLSLLEQEKFEEATESLVQTALTLGLLDVGGGAVLPIAEDIVGYVKSEGKFGATRRALKEYNRILTSQVLTKPGERMNIEAIKRARNALKTTFNDDAAKFPRASKVGKAFTKASKWLKGASVFDVLGPLTDVLTIGLNGWGLDMAIKEGNEAGIAASSLSIIAGVVGLVTFVGAIITGSAALGPVGVIVGVLLGIAATIIELWGGVDYNRAAAEAFRKKMQRLNNLREASLAQIEKKMEYLDQVGLPYTDVYTNNQASSIVGGNSLAFVDSYLTNDREYKNSFVYRKYMGSDRALRNAPAEARKEMSNRKIVCIGNYDSRSGPKVPTKEGCNIFRMCYKILYGHVGFDFYGKFKEDTTFGGVTVFVGSDLVSTDENLEGFRIVTDSPSMKLKKDDVISIGDYRNLRQEITIDTGYGSDSLNINGMIGKFHDDYVNKFKATLGLASREGFNILSFQGMSKDRDDVKGVYFNAKTSAMKFFHGESSRSRQTHLVGHVYDVYQFQGSPFDDHVVFTKPRGYNVGVPVVYQTSGSNTYGFDFDEFDLGERRSAKFQITDLSEQPMKINLKTSDESKIEAHNIVLSYKTLKIYSSKGRNKHIPRIEISLKNPKIRGQIFINNNNPQDLDVKVLNPRLLKGTRKNFKIGRGSSRYTKLQSEYEDSIFLMCPDHYPSSATFTVDLTGGVDFVVISDKHFLDPCEIDGETVTLTVKKSPDFESTGKFFVIVQKHLDDDEGPKFRIQVEFKNTERIINEYGDRLVAFDVGRRHSSYSSPMDLFNRYMYVTRNTLKIKTTTKNEID